MNLNELTLTTPGLFFPAASLLLLAYTNRFLALASLVRHLHQGWRSSQDQKLLQQIQYLHARLILIRGMQLFGVLSLCCSLLCMLALFADMRPLAGWVFIASCLSLLLSLIITLIEIWLSNNALDVLLAEMRQGDK
jgi:hypothetical protein